MASELGDLTDVLGCLLREMQAQTYQVGCTRKQAAEMLGLSPDGDTFRSVEKHLRRRRPSGPGGRVLYSVASIREYMGDIKKQ